MPALVSPSGLFHGQTCHPTDWVHRAPPAQGLERIEAYFAGHGYDMHRHDTYAIGRTLRGVQSFQYRGGWRHSLPGGTMVLHPDEAHDGEAGTQDGFHYRMLYVEPALIQQILGGQPLPFIAGGLSADPRLFAATDALLRSVEHTMDPLEQQDALFDLAHALNRVSGVAAPRQRFDYQAAERAREYIHSALDRTLTLDELAAHSQCDRWSLSRFSPAVRHQSLPLPEHAPPGPGRALLVQGQPLAHAALAAGFADQSHMTRQFRQAYGLPPARWLKMLGR